MIEVRVGRLEEAEAQALLRPVAADGSAVTAAMRRFEAAAGPAPAAQFERQGDLPVGSATLTGAGELGADFIVNVVVRSASEPVTEAGVERGLINGLRRVREWAIDHVALVPIGTGAGNLDPEVAAGLLARVLDAERHEGLRVTVLAESEYEREIVTRALG